MAPNELRDRLKRAIDEHRRLKAPLAGDCDLQDADVDLFAEDGYIFGLAEAALLGRPTEHRLIRLDKSIDERIAGAVSRGGSAASVAEKFEAYRASVLRLARLTSEVSGLPIEEWSRRG